MACLAVLTALVFAFASFLLTSRPWPRHGLRLGLFTVRVQRLSIRPVWVHPRTHLLCVMRT